MSIVHIPLFPLSIVLFPDQAVPLHIFESRYREMTRHCIETRSPFGLVFVHTEQIADTGCSALIVKTVKEYEDGRSDILTIGQRIFHLIRMYEDRAYFEADVEYVDDDFDGIDTGVTAELERLFKRCHRILYQSEPASFEPKRGASLAYHIASELPLDDGFRQSLLEVRMEAERQRRLAERLAEWYPQLEKRENVRAKASSNGHGNL
jgi:Lon protease-like protein